MATLVDAVGYAAAALAAAMWWPQASRCWRLRRDPTALASVSAATFAVALVFNASLLLYGVLEGAVPVQLAAAGNLLAASTILAVVGRSRRAAR